MIKDIPIRKVEDLAVALAPRLPHEEDSDIFWDAWLINFKDAPIRSVLVNSSGYGEIDGEPRRTAAMRYFWEYIGPLEAVKIEPVHVDVLNMANEFWVSFSFDDYLFDKRYIFVTGSLDDAHFIELPFLDRRGVMIR